jgi:hypothetical protein
MDTPSKRKPAAKRATFPKLATAPAVSSAKPFLRFYHSEELRKRTMAMLTALKVANAGFIVEQSAGIGMTGVQQLAARRYVLSACCGRTDRRLSALSCRGSIGPSG